MKIEWNWNKLHLAISILSESRSPVTCQGPQIGDLQVLQDFGRGFWSWKCRGLFLWRRAPRCVSYIHTYTRELHTHIHTWVAYTHGWVTVWVIHTHGWVMDESSHTRMSHGTHMNGSWHTHERVVSVAPRSRSCESWHTWMSDCIHTNHDTHEWVSVHTRPWPHSSCCGSHGIYTNESWHTHEWLMAHTRMSHGPLKNESWHTHERVVCVASRSTTLCASWPTWMSHGTHTNESWQTYEWHRTRTNIHIPISIHHYQWVMARIRMRHGTHVKIIAHMQMDTYE